MVPGENLELKDEIHELRLPGMAFGALPLAGVLGGFADFLSSGLSGALAEIGGGCSAWPLTFCEETPIGRCGDDFLVAFRSAFVSDCTSGFSWTDEAAALVRKI